MHAGVHVTMLNNKFGVKARHVCQSLSQAHRHGGVVVCSACVQAGIRQAGQGRHHHRSFS